MRWFGGFPIDQLRAKRTVAEMTAHTDIAATGWVARMPRAWRPYLLLARVDRPIGTWLLFLPGSWGILLSGAAWTGTIRLLLLFGIGSLAMRAAGCVVNDLWDRDIDRLVARTAGRPLASGVLRPWQALAFLTALLVVGLAVLLQLNHLSQALGVASLVLVALYPLAKRITWWPQLMMGFTFGFGAPMGYAAGAGHLGAAWLLIYAAAILWDLGFDTIYAHQDREEMKLVADEPNGLAPSKEDVGSREIVDPAGDERAGRCAGQFRRAVRRPVIRVRAALTH